MLLWVACTLLSGMTRFVEQVEDLSEGKRLLNQTVLRISDNIFPSMALLRRTSSVAAGSRMSGMLCMTSPAKHMFISNM